MKSVWLLWSPVTAITCALGLTLGERLLIGIDGLLVRLLVLLITSGLFIGFGQWMILRTRLVKAGGWILATAIGLTFCFSVGSWILDRLPGNILAIEIWIVIGSTLTGILQWYTLQKKLSGGLKWILVSAASWGIAINATYLIVDAYFSWLRLGNWGTPLLGGLIGAFVGIISGAFVETSLLRPYREAS